MGYYRLEPGCELNIREYVYFERGKPEFPQLTELSAEELEKRRVDSIGVEKELCRKVDAAVTEWIRQAQQTQQYTKALQYIRTPPVRHTSNQWQTDQYGQHEMSNMVYRFWWREYERTRWDRALNKSVTTGCEVTWYLLFNTPENSDESSRGIQIAGQERKAFPDRAAMEKYLQGRIHAYAHLFTEISPPIPEEHKRRFYINGQLMRGYTIEVKESEQPDKAQVSALLDCLDDLDIEELPGAPQKKPVVGKTEKNRTKKKQAPTR